MNLLPALLISILVSLVTEAQTISDTGCGDTKACYKAPEGCTFGNDCEYFLSYANGTSSADFEIMSNRTITTGTGWAAVGFSNDMEMGNDSVVMCINSGLAIETPTVKNAFNTGEVNAVSTDSTGLSNTAASVTDNVLSCSFTRAYSVVGNDNFFDIQSTSFYFLMGTGPVTDGVPSHHENNPYVSNTVLNIQSKDDVMASEGGSHSDEHSDEHPEEVGGVASLLPAATLTLSLCGLVMALFH